MSGASRQKVMFAVGVVLLVTFLTPKTLAKINVFRQPAIDIPVSLAQGEVRLPEFSPKKSDHFLILIRVQKRLPFDQLNRMMGLRASKLSLTNADYSCESILGAEWRILDGNQVVAQGSTRDEASGEWANHTIARYLGHFVGMPGHWYVLEVRFTTDGSALDKTNPHLVVEIKKPWD